VLLGRRVAFHGSGEFGELASSPDGRRLLVTWADGRSVGLRARRGRAADRRRVGITRQFGAMQRSPAGAAASLRPRMLKPGDRIPLDATVWLGPNQPVTLREVVEERPVLLLFYLFDWTST